MHKKTAEEVVKDLDEDQRMDLLMYLAEQFDLKVSNDKEEVTYFLATDGKFPAEG